MWARYAYVRKESMYMLYKNNKSKPSIKFISRNDNFGIKIKNPRPEFTNQSQWSRKAVDAPKR